ncbi:MAG: hypothetical protein [Caudoviricetes sp.]|nr:MAG: hypothetical protein [Caudoviricetes sp.]
MYASGCLARVRLARHLVQRHGNLRTPNRHNQTDDYADLREHESEQERPNPALRAYWLGFTCFHQKHEHQHKNERRKRDFPSDHFPALNLARLRVKSIVARLAAACSRHWS